MHRLGLPRPDLLLKPKLLNLGSKDLLDSIIFTNTGSQDQKWRFLQIGQKDRAKITRKRSVVSENKAQGNKRNKYDSNMYTNMIVTNLTVICLVRIRSALLIV